jgi:hypothetical protein
MDNIRRKSYLCPTCGTCKTIVNEGVFYYFAIVNTILFPASFLLNFDA